MNKKVIAAGMAMVLASMGLTACGDSGSKEAKDSSDETYTVTMAYIGDKEEDTDRIEKKINEIMKKDINMELDIEPISWGAYAETMKLILSGGEKMDIVPILVEQVNSMVNAKQVIDMSIIPCNFPQILHFHCCTAEIICKIRQDYFIILILLE